MDIYTVFSGVPQGSHLGQLLFIKSSNVFHTKAISYIFLYLFRYLGSGPSHPKCGAAGEAHSQKQNGDGLQIPWPTLGEAVPGGSQEHQFRGGHCKQNRKFSHQSITKYVIIYPVDIYGVVRGISRVVSLLLLVLKIYFLNLRLWIYAITHQRVCLIGFRGP